MSILPSAYPEQLPIYLRSGDPIKLPEHHEYVDLREYLRRHTVATLTDRALEHMGAKKSNVLVRSISEYPYNCVGMVLGNRRVWIDMNNDEIEISLTKDGYRKILPGESSIGDVVLYKHENEFTHIGVVICVDRQNINNIWILSKWGFAGEMIHHVLDVPSEYGLVSQYWTERVAHDNR